MHSQGHLRGWQRQSLEVVSIKQEERESIRGSLLVSRRLAVLLLHYLLLAILDVNASSGLALEFAALEVEESALACSLGVLNGYA